MNKSGLRKAFLPLILVGTFAALDLLMDYLVRDTFGFDWSHTLLAAVVLLISFAMMSRALETQRRAATLLGQARDELETRVCERTAELERANGSLRTSEKTARALMDVMTESAVLIEPDGVIRAANQTLARNLGVTAERLVGSSLFDLFPPEVAEGRRAHLNAILQSGQPQHFVDSREGRTFDNHVCPVFDADGKIVRIAAFGQDITERLHVEALLRDTVERLEFTLAAAGAGSWDWDVPTGRIVWSSKMFELFGLNERSTAASFDVWRSAIHPDDREVADERISQALATHSVLESEYRVVLPSGEICWISALGEGTYDSQGEPIRMSGICLDVTDRKRSETTIRYLSSFPQLNPNPVLEVDASGTIIFTNPGAAKTLEQLAQGDDASAFLPDDLATILAQLENGENDKFQREVQVGSGHFAETIQVMPSSSVVRIYAFDITERKRAEDALRSSEEKYRLLFQNMAEGFGLYEILYDSQGQPVDWRILEVNDAYARHTGIAREQIEGRRISELFPAAIPQYLPLFAEVVANGTPTAMETYAEAVGRFQHIATFPAGGHRFASIIEDITGRKRSEEALRRAQEVMAEDIRERSALEERQRLARELHDSVSQALYGVSLGINTALTALDTDRRRVLDALNYALDLTRAGLAEMRALIFELRPESLEVEGLAVALTKQAEAVRARHGIEVGLNLCAEPNVPMRFKEALYRIAQESIQNAVKHAHAMRIDVRLSRGQESLDLEVLDDGVGFDVQVAHPGHLGLHSMRERAQGVDGAFEVLSEPGHGTRVHATVPLQAE